MERHKHDRETGEVLVEAGEIIQAPNENEIDSTLFCSSIKKILGGGIAVKKVKFTFECGNQLCFNVEKFISYRVTHRSKKKLYIVKYQFQENQFYAHYKSEERMKRHLEIVEGL